MTHRLEESNRTVSWTVTAEVCVGYHDCGVCRIETPEPTMDQMLEFAQSRSGCFMWPDRDKDGCTPTGWEWDGEEGWICPDCVAARNAAFALRRKPRRKEA
jgi:hypothetical protein